MACPAALRPILLHSTRRNLEQCIVARAWTPSLVRSSWESWSRQGGSTVRSSIWLSHSVHSHRWRRPYSTQPSGTKAGGLETESSREPPQKVASDLSEQAGAATSEAVPFLSSSPAKQKQQPQPQPKMAELPSAADERRSQLQQRFSTFMDTMQSRVLVASQALNDLTGYSAIESIKAANARLEAETATAATRLREARLHYKTVNASRAATQREVTTLLARKDSWSPQDLERFTALYRTDHELEAGVADAAAQLTEAETEESRLSAELNAGILRRYHEEQIWSDRIRRQSTWGTWGLMGVNFLLFLILQFVAEPWKRSRLMKNIAAEERAAFDEVRRELAEVRDALNATATAAAGASPPQGQPDVSGVSAGDGLAVSESSTASGLGPEGTESVAGTRTAASSKQPVLTPTRTSWGEAISNPSRWGPALRDLASERQVDLTMKDVSLIALEGAAAGAAVVASIAFVFFRQA